MSYSNPLWEGTEILTGTGFGFQGRDQNFDWTRTRTEAGTRNETGSGRRPVFVRDWDRERDRNHDQERDNGLKKEEKCIIALISFLI